MKTNNHQKAALTLCLLATFYYLFSIGKYWSADVLYNQGKNLNRSQKYSQARAKLLQAIKLSPRQAVYWDELSRSSAGLSLADQAIEQINRAIQLSPANFHLWKAKAVIYLQASLLNEAARTLELTLPKSPADAKLYYNLGLIYEQLGQPEQAIAALAKAVDLKANYKEARYALAIFYKRQGDGKKAKEELDYILNYLAPQDYNSQKLLEELKNGKIAP